MISLHRDRSTTAIHEKFRGAKKQQKDLELLRARRQALSGTDIIIAFQATYWKTAKTQLKKESGGKCAYCEANTDVVAHGDVEHYRPKSVYWWLAYTYDNYLYVCQICNQSYKGDHFPLAGNALFAGPPVTAHSTDAELAQLAGLISPDPLRTTPEYSLHRYLQEHTRERALLLNPYFDDPQVVFAYEADDLTQEVTIVPTAPAYQKHVQAAADYYGLNRIELKNLRYKIYRFHRLLSRSLANLTDAHLKGDIQRQLQSMEADDHLFAGMNRYFAAQP